VERKEEEAHLEEKGERLMLMLLRNFSSQNADR